MYAWRCRSSRARSGSDASGAARTILIRAEDSLPRRCRCAPPAAAAAAHARHNKANTSIPTRAIAAAASAAAAHARHNKANTSIPTRAIAAAASPPSRSYSTKQWQDEQVKCELGGGGPCFLAVVGLSNGDAGSRLL
jgi:hypothetical protein